MEFGSSSLENLDLISNPFTKCFQGKKIFITGHTGFKGAWLSLWLYHLGAQIVGYSLPPPSTPSLFELLHLQKFLHHIDGDVNDYSHLQSAIESHKPEMVFHLAAQPIVLESYRDPLSTIRTNVMGTVNLLEILRKYPCAKFCILATSDKCYQKQNRKIIYEEHHALGGSDPYSASKGAVEILIHSYYHSFFSPKNSHNSTMGIASVRAGNVIGGGDWGSHRLVPDFFRFLHQGQRIHLRNPTFCRPWQHVIEALSGYLCLATHLLMDPHQYSGPWNFGPKPQDALPVRELIRLLLDVAQLPLSLIKEDTDSKIYEDCYLHLSSQKAETHLKWCPIYSPHERVQKTWEWHEKYLSNPEMVFETSLAQIKEFENLAHFYT